MNMEHFSTNLQAISNELNLKNYYNDSEVLINYSRLAWAAGFQLDVHRIMQSTVIR